MIIYMLIIFIFVFVSSLKFVCLVAVGRWDDNGISLSKKSETRAVGTAQIGYIGDEW